MHFCGGRYEVTWTLTNTSRPFVNRIPCRTWGHVERNVSSLLRLRGVTNIKVYDNTADRYVNLPDWMAEEGRCLGVHGC